MAAIGRTMVAHPGHRPRYALFWSFVAGGQHLQRGIIREQRCTILYPFGDGLGQWFQQSGRFTHPVRHSRAIQIDTLTGIDL